MGTTFNKAWGSYIPDGIINSAIASWQAKQPEREQTNATPSSLTDCPRVVWLKYRKKIPPSEPMSWAKKQRNMLGRITENTIASQLRDEGILLYHWKDDTAGESIRFAHGEGLTKIDGTPDLLIKTPVGVAISDSKTSRGDSFNYVPINDKDIWKDHLWYKYYLQLTAYYMLCHWNKDWFKIKRDVKDMPDTAYSDDLPLPAFCHLFSYALDDGIVRRETKPWKPTKQDMVAVNFYTRRWNQAYASETIPVCTCIQDDPENLASVKFCYYAQEFEFTKSGYKLGTKCCGDDLLKQEGSL